MRILTAFLVTRACILTRTSSTSRHRLASLVGSTLAYPVKDPQINDSRSFGFMLSPVYYRRRNARPVSYYALFKWWLLLSQHPGCLSTPTSLCT